MEDYNKELCERVHKDMDEKIKALFDKFETLDGRINKFYLLAISTLVTLLFNILKDLFLK